MSVSAGVEALSGISVGASKSNKWLTMRGARVAAAFLSAIPAVAIGILLAKPPRGAILPVRYTWDWPMWVTLAVSVLAILFSFRLGGAIEDIEVKRGSSRNQSLH